MSETTDIQVELQEPDGNQQVTFITIGGRRYPYKTIHNCQICRSIHRNEIEQALLTGMTNIQVLHEVIETYEFHSPIGTPSLGSLSRHLQQKHMPSPFMIQREVIERRAKEMGRNIRDGEEFLVDSMTVIRTIVQKGYTRLSEGEIQPSMGDMLKAIQIQHSVEATQAVTESMDDGVEMWRAALMEYMKIVQGVVSPADFQRIGLEMSRSPVLQAISRKRVAGALEE